jgi:hypothetical protein
MVALGRQTVRIADKGLMMRWSLCSGYIAEGWASEGRIDCLMYRSVLIIMHQELHFGD